MNTINGIDQALVAQKTPSETKSVPRVLQKRFSDIVAITILHFFGRLGHPNTPK